jgi:hypothetical protein
MKVGDLVTPVEWSSKVKMRIGIVCDVSDEWIYIYFSYTQTGKTSKGWWPKNRIKLL